jgi:hypothetical protein
MAEYAGFFAMGLIVLMIAMFPLWVILPDVMREKARMARVRAMEEARHKAAVADMWRNMAAIGLHPSDYTKEQLRQMQERA